MAQELMNLTEQVVHVKVKRGRDPDHHEHRQETGSDEQPSVSRLERTCPVQSGDTFRVHEDLADPEPHEERAGHPLSAFVEELTQVPVRADRHYEIRSP